MMVTDFFTPSLSSVVATLNLLILGTVTYPCTGIVSESMINANHGNNSLACPGEELVYTCVSRGDSQRWHIINQDGSSIVHLYLRTDDTGVQLPLTDRNQNRYTLVLISTAYDNFISTISAVATLSMHNTMLECRSSLPPVSTVIKIAGIPMSPLNIQNIVDEYHSYFSTVLFTWNAPEDNSRVDYYQYTYQVDDGSVSASNTSNTSVAISGVPYNKNVTFSVLAGNCIGESVSVLETVNIVGCNKIDDSLFGMVNASTFSQAPGTEILISCNNSDRENSEIIYSTCQDDGRWEPDPSSGLCPEFQDPSNTATDSKFDPCVTLNYSMPSLSVPGHPLMPILCITAALIAVTVGFLAGVITGCLFKLTVRWKKRSLRESREYDVIDPVYETVTGITIDSNHPGTQIRTENNNAYKSARVNTTDNEAYIHNTSKVDVLQMDHNKSYQAASFNCTPERPMATSTQEGYEIQSHYINKHIQQVTVQANVPSPQSNEQVDLQDAGQSSVDINVNKSASYSLTEVSVEPQQHAQGIHEPELSCEKQSINLKDIK